MKQTNKHKQIPERAGGFEVHEHQCKACQTFPIIGNMFVCLDCRGFSLCKKTNNMNKNKQT